MKLIQIPKIYRRLFLFICISFVYGCTKKSLPGNLTITLIKHSQTGYSKYLDLPNGVYQPDNPDFDIKDPETWTGNMAQYVVHNYTYSVTYQVRNSGEGIAFDTELDLYSSFNNGEEEVRTVYLGDIKPNQTRSNSITVSSTNKQLVECGGEVFWY